MLGALISFIGFVLAICWWALAKQFRKYRKGEAPMSAKNGRYPPTQNGDIRSLF